MEWRIERYTAFHDLTSEVADMTGAGEPHDRMSMRRFTQLTDAFSKKLENHAHMVALYALWYNLVRASTRRSASPRRWAAGIADKLWSMEDVVAPID
jgi:hypothetical protein